MLEDGKIADETRERERLGSRFAAQMAAQRDEEKRDLAELRASEDLISPCHSAQQRVKE